MPALKRERKKNNWSLNKKEWMLLKETLAPYEWKRTELHILYRDRVPQEPGVYLICSGCPFVTKEKVLNNLYNTLYVGKSEISLRSRFMDHCKNPKDELGDAKLIYSKIDYWFAEIPPEIIDDVETIIIDCFGPPVNFIRGKGTIKARLIDPVRA